MGRSELYTRGRSYVAKYIQETEDGSERDIDIESVRDGGSSSTIKSKTLVSVS